ncbi:hypothetical protein TanjilG_28269 [Lupinus angustifolius]|uniref:Transcription elongation factor Eaf N-terminal domain-containing protein n=1 Tax=Lupinus angustifolius TaxID=3871 RepID=A0A1J7HJA1_LUPAN|nr:hypothetical protein TanjilG_28269 [Lupinus angustifolius]
MANKSKEEPKNAPDFARWYDLSLGPSFKDESSSKYCTLRYEFKPASVDRTKPGSMRKTKENRVSVEFQNNQIGKPKVTFEGSSEEYRENDAVLFFDGTALRLERLHSAVKQLRHLRMPGESAATAAASVTAPSGPPLDQQSSPIGKSTKPAPLGRSSFQAVAKNLSLLIPKPMPYHSAILHTALFWTLEQTGIGGWEKQGLGNTFNDIYVDSTQVEVERIDIGEPENTGIKSSSKRPSDQLIESPIISVTSPVAKNDVEEHQDVNYLELFGSMTPEDDHNAEEKDNVGFDINVPHTDDEIADVDDSGDEVDKGPNAAEALRAQVIAAGRDAQTTTSSSNSATGSSDTDSSTASSSSSDSEASDEDVVNIM